MWTRDPVTRASEIRVSKEMTCRGGESIHWLVVRVAVRNGKPKDCNKPAPIVHDYEATVAPFIDALCDVLPQYERAEVKRVVNEILKVQ